MIYRLPLSLSSLKCSLGGSADIDEEFLTSIGEKPYGCHMCFGKFSTKGNLRGIRKLIQEKTRGIASNQQCGGRLRRKKSLKIHMRKHTGERPYACKVCGKGFAQTGILHTHMAMHLDKKNALV